jgi:hypothetical protein
MIATFYPKPCILNTTSIGLENKIANEASKGSNGNLEKRNGRN